MHAITEPEHQELKRLEAIISRGKKAFAEVGAALYQIRENKLFRVTHRTFESYVQEKWGFERRHADRLIDAAEVVENVSHGTQKQPILPSSERVARELAKLPAEEQAEAWEEVIETTAVPTAKVVKGVVEKRIEAKADQSRHTANVETPKVAATESEKRPPKTERQFFVELRKLFDDMDEFHKQQSLELWSQWLLDAST
jgi:hypothetical protein